MDNFYYGLLFGPWREVTHDDPGHLGGDPHFIPPPHDAASLRAQGVVEGPRRSTTAEADRRARLKREK